MMSKAPQRLRFRGSIGAVVVAGFVLTIASLGAGPDASKSKKNAASNATKIDSALNDAWKSAKVKPSRPATDEEFLRRAYIDLLGRIPNVQEATAFLENKEKGNKRAKLVNYLLEHPDFAKNFGTEWGIILIGRKPQGRDVDKAGLTGWLRQQITANRPWNEVASDLITARGSSKENGNVNYPMAHMQEGAVNLTSITTRVFLGQQIQCTQCHDHPSNNWKQADFWSINAFFKGMKAERVMKADATGAEVYDYTELRDEPTNAHARYEKRNAVIEIAYPTYLDGTKVGSQTMGDGGASSETTDFGRMLVEGNRKLAASVGTPKSANSGVDLRESLAKFITDKDKKQLAKAFANRAWGHFMGRGVVSPVDDFGDHNPPSNPALLDALAEEFLASQFDIKAMYRTIMASQAYQLSSVTTKDNEKDETLFSHMGLKPMTPEQLFDSLITATSAHKAAGKDFDAVRNRWLNQFVVTFANDEEGESSNFQGTIPQALMMMNGDLIATATGGKSGSFLADTVERSRVKGAGALFVVNRLYLAALSRYPSSSEVAKASAFLSANPDSIQVVEDLFWSLLNCNEFVLNH